MALSVNNEIYFRRSLGGDFGMVQPGQVGDYFAISTTQSTVTLSATPSGDQPVFVFKNNILLTYTTNYAISGTTVTFVTNLVNGDKVRCFYDK